MIERGKWATPVLLVICFSLTVHGQIDPEKRRLIQLGYNQPLEGRAPIAGYGFYYYNKPQFLSTNLTLRLAIAPIFLDAELGYSGLFGRNSDLAIGLAGGGYADSYSEIRQGVYRRDESFTGHGGEVSMSLYHRFNPEAAIPLWFILRGSSHRTVFNADDETDPRFEVPSDRDSYNVRTGLRFGGQEPTMTAPLAMELSAWHESRFRTESETYGFSGDRQVEAATHLFWGRGLLKYTFEPSQRWLELGLTAGTSMSADRFSAYRLGGVLPFASEFPLMIPGYYYQEISARRFALLHGQFSMPLTPSKHWNLISYGSMAAVDYLNSLEQPGQWHSGVGAGLTFTSPSGSWFVTLVYGHGFDAIRSAGRGANGIGLLFQYDFDAKDRGRPTWFQPPIGPYRSRAGERLFH